MKWLIAPCAGAKYVLQSEDYSTYFIKEKSLSLMNGRIITPQPPPPQALTLVDPKLLIAGQILGPLALYTAEPHVRDKIVDVAWDYASRLVAKWKADASPA